MITNIIINRHPSRQYCYWLSIHWHVSYLLYLILWLPWILIKPSCKNISIFSYRRQVTWINMIFYRICRRRQFILYCMSLAQNILHNFLFLLLLHPKYIMYIIHYLLMSLYSVDFLSISEFYIHYLEKQWMLLEFRDNIILMEQTLTRNVKIHFYL